jgi:hypothetical protein
MNHHTQYLLESIKIVNHLKKWNEGIVITYHFENKELFMIADPERLTMLLMDCNLINDRRESSNGWYVNVNGQWQRFSWYITEVNYSDADLLLLCAEHESRKIIEAVPDIFMAARFKPLCYN